MGMYTEILIKADIKIDIPTKVHEILTFLFTETDVDKPKDLPDHPFFKYDEWTLIGRCSSYYHIPTCLNFYEKEYLFSRSDLKNYGNEIDLFFDWIDPYICAYEGKCIGYSWYEESDEPTLIYKKKEIENPTTIDMFGIKFEM